MIDATIVAAPKQKLTVDEKAVIKEGGALAGWSKAKRRQKDRDARWTLKRGRSKPKPEGGAACAGVEIAVPVFGYKSHLNIDRRHGLIRGWAVTDAAAHDSRSLPDLLDAENTASGKMARAVKASVPVCADLAAAVGFLAGSDGGWINGQVLRVNGGII